MVFYKAILDVIGDEKFNLNFNSFKKYQDYLPGDWRYFSNKGYDAVNHPSAQGENVIQLPNGSFYGFPVGGKTEKNMLTELNGMRDSGSTKPANLNDDAKRFNFDAILEMRE